MNAATIIAHVVYSDIERLHKTCATRRRYDKWDNIDDAVNDAIIRTIRRIGWKAERGLVSPERIYLEFTHNFDLATKRLHRHDERSGLVVGSGRTGLPHARSAVRGVDWSTVPCYYEHNDEDTIRNDDDMRRWCARQLVSVLDEMRPGIVTAAMKAMRGTKTNPGVGAGIARELGISTATACRLLNRYREHVAQDVFLAHLLKIVLGDEYGA